ncbi:MAG TPA: CoA-binding protein, partial [Negativicutes bacterium]|nr:CoA-binding protein [Negativicutes bacterium]
EILFVGYSSKDKMFSNGVLNAFVKNGFKVYPMNSRTKEGFDVKVYQTFEELPKVPETAYVLLKSENARKVIKPLKDNGVKRILFQNNKVADKEILDQCSQMGIEAAIGCPMMLFGSGLHRVHAFFAGVKR